MENFLIRHASINDLSGLVKLEQECFTTDLLSKHSFQHLISANSAAVLVATHERNIIGSLVIFFRKNSKIARLNSVAVHTNHRRQGIAEALCQQMEEIARQRDCTLLQLEVCVDNHAAIKFYNKSGYNTFAEHAQFYEDGTNAFRMRKNILFMHEKGSALT